MRVELTVGAERQQQAPVGRDLFDASVKAGRKLEDAPWLSRIGAPELGGAHVDVPAAQHEGVLLAERLAIRLEGDRGREAGRQRCGHGLAEASGTSGKRVRGRQRAADRKQPGAACHQAEAGWIPRWIGVRDRYRHQRKDRHQGDSGPSNPHAADGT